MILKRGKKNIRRPRVSSWLIRESLFCLFILKKNLKQHYQCYYNHIKKIFLFFKISMRYYYLKNLIQMNNILLFFLPTYSFTKNKQYIISDFKNKFLNENVQLKFFSFLKIFIKFAKHNCLSLKNKPHGLTYFFISNDIRSLIKEKEKFFEIYKEYINYKSISFYDTYNVYNQKLIENSNTTLVQNPDLDLNINFDWMVLTNKMYVLEIYKILIYTQLNIIISIYF